MGKNKDKRILMDVDITIIGAGVIGLAIAQELSEQNKNVYLLEKHLSFRTGNKQQEQRSNTCRYILYQRKP